MTSTDSQDVQRCQAIPLLICRRPYLIVVAVLAITLLAIFQIVNPRTGEVHVHVNPSEQALLGEEHEGWEFYQSTRRIFGNDETIMVAIDADDAFSTP